MSVFVPVLVSVPEAAFVDRAIQRDIAGAGNDETSGRCHRGPRLTTPAIVAAAVVLSLLVIVPAKSCSGTESSIDLTAQVERSARGAGGDVAAAAECCRNWPASSVPSWIHVIAAVGIRTADDSGCLCSTLKSAHRCRRAWKSTNVALIVARRRDIESEAADARASHRSSTYPSFWNETPSGRDAAVERHGASVLPANMAVSASLLHA